MPAPRPLLSSSGKSYGFIHESHVGHVAHLHTRSAKLMEVFAPVPPLPNLSGAVTCAIHFSTVSLPEGPRTGAIAASPPSGGRIMLFKPMAVLH